MPGLVTVLFILACDEGSPEAPAGAPDGQECAHDVGCPAFCSGVEDSLARIIEESNPDNDWTDSLSSEFQGFCASLSGVSECDECFPAVQTWIDVRFAGVSLACGQGVLPEDACPGCSDAKAEHVSRLCVSRCDEYDLEVPAEVEDVEPLRTCVDGSTAERCYDMCVSVSMDDGQTRADAEGWCESVSESASGCESCWELTQAQSPCATGDFDEPEFGDGAAECYGVCEEYVLW